MIVRSVFGQRHFRAYPLQLFGNKMQPSGLLKSGYQVLSVSNRLIASRSKFVTKGISCTSCSIVPQCCITRMLHKDTVSNPKVNIEDVFSKKIASNEEYEINLDLINHLERLSLVDFGNEEALVRLQEAIEFSQILFEVDTTGIEPMTSVLDDATVRLRRDIPINTPREDIIKNAAIIEEDYFVSPPGNIPLTPKTSLNQLKS